MVASPAPLPISLPDESRLKLEDVEHTGDVIVIVASTTAEAVRCPVCGISSERVHSRHCRTLRDLPSQGLRIRIRLHSRRFYCLCRACERRIFTERLPTLAETYARQTGRQRLALKVIAYALGGEAGVRLATQLGIDCSADTLLRVLKQPAGVGENKSPRILGVDDWAWRKRHRYGTVLVDLERRRAIDLLPDRECKTLVNWLSRHPGVEVITRDRAGAYAEAAQKGAPDALQVADRFHILCNLTQALQRLLERFAGSLQRLRLSEPDMLAAANEAETQTDKTGIAKSHDSEPKLNHQETVSARRHDERKARYDAVQAAFQDGLSRSEIARRFCLTRNTVRGLLLAEEFPERAPRRRRSALEPFHEYLQKRWAEGCHNASQLCRELRRQGYKGQRSRVKEYLHPWRSGTRRHSRVKRKLPNLRLVAFWLGKPQEKRNTHEQQWVEAVTADNNEISTAEKLALRFRELLGAQDAGRLQSWLNAAEDSDIPELKSFANGIRRDYEAVLAGIRHSWSNGQVEGQVHRLKLLKRQMYGRAGFHLLRVRVLPMQALTCDAHSP